ncbi:hypothetical protein F5Y08DRAFT_320811 [Xylaria arbuscula]|nr:hypothetical protein F5Y08DRAFT_320811 [Xylaria arbuscula]
MDSVKTNQYPLYQELKQDPDEDNDTRLTLFNRPSPRSSVNSIISIILAFCVLILLVANGYLISSGLQRNEIVEATYWGTSKTMLKPFYWSTEFSSENKTETSPLWADLFPIGDGLVTLPDEWSSSQNLPASIKRYPDSEDSIYFVAAYHQLHCLAILRSVIYHLKEGSKLTVPFAHATHCLDSLRQSAMCHADDTLLYTVDTHTYGDGQPRLCKDWSALERWTKHHRIYVEGMEGL